MAVINMFSMFLSSKPELTSVIGKLIFWLYQSIGNFGWAIVVFTLILKTLVLPLDIWQRSVMRKNSNAMKKMKPQLEKLQKQYGSDKQAFSQKQMELYKKEGYSLIGSCIPMIVTMVIFFVVFAGFRKVVTYQNELTVWELAETYIDLSEKGASKEEIDNALIAKYEENMESFLWIENVFMPDSWADPVPTESVYKGTKIGNLNATLPDNIVGVDKGYEGLIEPIVAEYNKTKFFDMKHWNGYLVLPILMLIINILQLVLAPQVKPEDQPGMDEEKIQQQKVTSKMMQFTLPIIMVIFAVLYSSAFSIYMLISSLYTFIFTVCYTFITKRIDDKAEEERLRNTFKY